MGEEKADDIPQEIDGASSHWKPLDYDPALARASVRLRFVKMFSPKATSWNKDQELPKQRSDRWLSDEIAKFRGGGGPGHDGMSRLWANSYGVPNVARMTAAHVDAALGYVDDVFKPVIGEAAAAVLAQMADFVMAIGRNATALEQLTKFRKNYEGLVEALRKENPKSIDACSMISQYDNWVVYLVDIVNNGGGNRRHLRSTDNLKGLVDKALLSKEAAQKAVQEAMKGVMGSPIIDLQSFIVLANEMQTQCARVTLRNGDDDEQIKKSRAILEERVDSSGFFGKLDRILEIVEDTRVDEPFHGLVVASTLGRRNEMRLYGTKAVHGLRHVLERVTPDANWAHPVLLMTAALFQGDPDPIELRQLETYFDDGHHAEVLEAESGISAGTFQRHIEKALKRAREKWRAGGA